MEVTLTKYPTEEDWLECKRRALVTIGKDVKNPPDDIWKEKMLRSRHSPIRWLMFSFYIKDVPSWVSVHLCRHVHAQPYVKSQRNDRQSDYDREAARQDTPVNMIYDVNAEEFLTICNKRLCGKTAEKTREVVQQMCRLVAETNPEFVPFMVPNCRHLKRCPEFEPCDAGLRGYLDWRADLYSEPPKTIGESITECQESWEKWKEDLQKSMDAGKDLKEKFMLDALRDAIVGNLTQEEIDDIKARLAESEKCGFEEHKADIQERLANDRKHFRK